MALAADGGAHRRGVGYRNRAIRAVSLDDAQWIAQMAILVWMTFLTFVGGHYIVGKRAETERRFTELYAYIKERFDRAGKLQSDLGDDIQRAIGELVKLTVEHARHDEQMRELKRRVDALYDQRSRGGVA